MSELFINLAGHTYLLTQDEFGTWLIEGKPYLIWLETDAPPEVVEAAAKKGLEVAVSDPVALEDAIERTEMPPEQANIMRGFSGESK